MDSQKDPEMVLSMFMGMSSLEQGIRWLKKDFSEHLAMQEWPYQVHYPVFAVNKGDCKYRANAQYHLPTDTLTDSGKEFSKRDPVYACL